MPSSVREVPCSVENTRGDAVDCDVRFVAGEETRPVVVFCHGFKGFKDWGPFPEWGRRLARAGFVAVHVNFSYNGVHRDAPMEFTELDKFADNTFTRELDDLRAVLDAVYQERLPEAPVDPDRMGLMGHSRGGGTAILQTDRDDRVDALATWSSVSTFVDRFTDEQIEDWEAQGFTEVVNRRTGQVMRLNKTLYDDARAHEEELDVRGAAERIDVPWLVVHARDDESVSFDAAQTLANATDAAELMEADGGHTFGGAHPFDGTVPESLVAVWERTIDFFRASLDNT
ncbi:MAG: alpha/beta hydrolase family protein [Salinibacter sp.]|uniref:alpha/beta hydrolase family protein n=1 Tax=Salinibacter sp. TaxID=2065818 RepID=UPI0035D4EF8D